MDSEVAANFLVLNTISIETVATLVAIRFGASTSASESDQTQCFY